MSEVVYRDSEMRTIKHELEHLFNTYDNEMRAREDIKAKINNHPDILKNHDLVVPEPWSYPISIAHLQPQKLLMSLRFIQ